MKLIATSLLLLTASILCTRAAEARSLNPAEVHSLLRGMGGDISVPAEWAGVWSIVDTTYDCNGVYKSDSASEDTLCAGHTFEGDPNIVCTGSATPTTFDQVCTGSTNIFPDCDMQFHMETHGERNGETYYSVSTITLTPVGTGKGCDLFPPSCTQFNTHATRTAGPPTAYCASPVRSATWGELKAHYR